MEANNHSKKNGNGIKRRPTWEDSTAQALIEWVTSHEPLVINEFYLNRQIPRRTYYDAVNRHDKLKEAHEFAMEKIAVYREKLAIKNNQGLNSALVYMLPYYSDMWKEQTEWRSKLKEDSNKSGPSTFIIEMSDNSKKEKE